jgi:hypothetical protein
MDVGRAVMSNFIGDSKSLRSILSMVAKNLPHPCRCGETEFMRISAKIRSVKISGRMDCQYRYRVDARMTSKKYDEICVRCDDCVVRVDDAIAPFAKDHLMFGKKGPPPFRGVLDEDVHHCAEVDPSNIDGGMNYIDLHISRIFDVETDVYFP